MTPSITGAPSIPYFCLDLRHAAHGQVASLILLGVVFIAAMTDLRTRRIPNWLTLPAALLGCGLGGLWYGLAGVCASGLGLCLWFALGFTFYRRVGGIGAGDVKLVMASAALLGTLPALELTFLALSLQILWLVGRWAFLGNLGANLRALGSWLYGLAIPGSAKVHFHPVGDSDQTPFAPFLLLATLSAVAFDLFL